MIMSDEIDVIANQPSSATLWAQGELRCLRIPSDDLMDLMRDIPEVSLSVLRQIVDLLTRNTQALEALKREQANASSPEASRKQ